MSTRNPEKDPDDWATGDEPVTGPQDSYPHTLAREAGQDVPDELTTADPSKEIDWLQEVTGRDSCPRHRSHDSARWSPGGLESRCDSHTIGPSVVKTVTVTYT
jgi:hypothetical protein